MDYEEEIQNHVSTSKKTSSSSVNKKGPTTPSAKKAPPLVIKESRNLTNKLPVKKTGINTRNSDPFDERTKGPSVKKQNVAKQLGNLNRESMNTDKDVNLMGSNPFKEIDNPSMIKLENKEGLSFNKEAESFINNINTDLVENMEIKSGGSQEQESLKMPESPVIHEEESTKEKEDDTKKQLNEEN